MRSLSVQIQPVCWVSPRNCSVSSQHNTARLPVSEIFFEYGVKRLIKYGQTPVARGRLVLFSVLQYEIMMNYAGACVYLTPGEVTGLSAGSVLVIM